MSWQRAEHVADIVGGDVAPQRRMLGNVAETGSSNIFMVKDGKVSTPPQVASILDGITRASVIDLLASLARDRGTAILLVTHEPRFTAWADRVVYLRDGMVVDETVMQSYVTAADLTPGATPMSPA